MNSYSLLAWIKEFSREACKFCCAWSNLILLLRCNYNSSTQFVSRPLLSCDDFILSHVSLTSERWMCCALLYKRNMYIKWDLRVIIGHVH